MDDKTKTLIKLLSYRRMLAGLTTAEIARRTGISQPTVYRILSGQSQHVQLDHIIKIGRLLGCSLQWDAVLSEEDLITAQADRKAEKAVRMLQGTSGLEGQGLSPKELDRIRKKTKRKILSGSDRKIWRE